MAAPLGNDYGLKLKDKEIRQRAYKAYCDWLARGKTKKSFYFKEEQEDGSLIMAHWQTIESYCKLFPEEFDPIKKEVAYAQGCAYWEDKVDDTAIGALKDTSVPTLNMIMRNKYKWDTPEHTNDVEESKADLNRFAKGQAQGRAARIEESPINRSEKQANSDVFPPSAHKFE